MNTNLSFNAEGYADGLKTVLEGFEGMVTDYFTADQLEPLLTILAGAFIVIGIWYGTRAILRAMRTPR